MGLLSVLRLRASVMMMLAIMLPGMKAQRIVGEIKTTSGSELSGSISPRARFATDEGLVRPEQQLQNLSLRFNRTEAQQHALDRLLLDQQNPRSSHYHQWLTPEEFRSRFGLGADDFVKISRWLRSEGFTNLQLARGGSYLRFSGTAAQAQAAFGAELHEITLHGEHHISNLTPLKMPAELLPITAAVTGLDDFSLKPHHISGTAQVSIEQAKRVKPQYTSSGGDHYLAPDDFHVIYDESALLAGGTTGDGVTIAVVGQADIDLADVAAFRSAAGLSASAPAIVLYGSDPGTPSNADLLESELDVEWAGAAAPGANILYVNSTSVIDGSLTEAIDKNLAPIISLSYGDCEADLGVAALAYYSLLLQQASAQGITVVAPAGDAGATDCDANVASASHGLSVDFPASSPQVTGVGGTSFHEAGGTYFSAVNNANGGSALSYIPETVWNDGSLGGIAAGGGGRSAYFAKPSWQAGQGVPNDFSRDVPDVVLNASPNHDPYLICTGGHCTNGFLDSSGNVEFVGGTSVGPPAFAGLLALVMQKTGARLGNANPVLYALGSSRYSASVFHDITSGANASACTVGSPDCSAGGSVGFAATAGYDLASGLGSVDAFQLINSWSAVIPVQASTGTVPSLTNASGDANNVRAGTSVHFTVSVASASAASSAVPTGSVQFTVNSVPVGTAAALTAGVAKYTLDTTTLSAGAQTVQATYSGDATFLGSKAAFTVNISAANAPEFSFLPSAATVTVASGQVAQGTLLTASALNGFTGKVQLTVSVPAAVDAEYSLSANPIDLTTASTGTSNLILFAYKGAPQIKRGAEHAALPLRSPRLFEGSIVAMGVCCFAVFRRRRLTALLIALLALGALQMTGCTTDTSPPSGNTATKAGSYPILITASATSNGVFLVHTSTVTLVVQ